MRTSQTNSILISLLLPTRNRPALVARLFDSINATAANCGRIEVILYIDDDDVASHQLDSNVFEVVRIIGPSLSMGEYNSACLARARGEIIVLANDDMVIRTIGWDNALIRADALIDDGIYLAYANDLIKKGGLSTFPILSRRTCTLLVDPYPAVYRGACIDTHLFDTFQRLLHAGFDRIVYLDEVVFEHLHFRAGKAPADDTYRRRGRFDDDATFVGLAESRRMNAVRLAEAIRGNPLPPTRTIPGDVVVPTGLIHAIAHFTRKSMLDGGLPWRWRWYLWYRFFGGYLITRGLLRRFLR